MDKFELGQEAEDLVTGFKGIITARVLYLSGCTQYCIKPIGVKADGDIKEGNYFDENQLVYIGEGVHGVIAPYVLRVSTEAEFVGDAPGGPQADKPKR